ncbi:MAG: hypothetical protein ACK56I_24045, partial [bacterium]
RRAAVADDPRRHRDRDFARNSRPVVARFGVAIAASRDGPNGGLNLWSVLRAMSIYWTWTRSQA